MFTGIIEDLATVESIRRRGPGALLAFRTALPLGPISLGDSIAVDGACLTVIAKGRGTISMEVSPETLKRTVLGELQRGDRINLERSLTLSKLLNGHLVTGHVDGVGRIVAVRAAGDSKLFTFEVAGSEARHLVEKGSVAIDGVSLTVFAIRARRFECALIPHTLRVTTLGLKGPGARVNVESDLLAKYIERVMTFHGRNGRAGTRRHGV